MLISYNRHFSFSHLYAKMLLFCLTVGISVAQSTGTGSISGRVIAADGRPLRAMLFLQSGTVPASGAGAMQRVRQRLPDAADGSFSFRQLPAGKYSLCAQPIGGQGRNADEIFLDSCEWNLPQTLPPLAAGQVLTNVIHILPQGALLQVDIDDKASLLPASAHPLGTASLDPVLDLNLRTPNLLLHHIPLTAVGTSGRSHAIALPFATALVLSMKSSRYFLTDSVGRALASETPIQIPVGTKPALIQVTVSGVRP